MQASGPSPTGSRAAMLLCAAPPATCLPPVLLHLPPSDVLVEPFSEAINLGSLKSQKVRERRGQESGVLLPTIPASLQTRYINARLSIPYQQTIWGRRASLGLAHHYHSPNPGYMVSQSISYSQGVWGQMQLHSRGPAIGTPRWGEWVTSQWRTV